MSSVFSRILLVSLASGLLWPESAAEEGATWLALGAPFRAANSGTIVNGDAEKKLPIYDQLVPEVYQFAERDDLHKGTLGFVTFPRWFAGVGSCKLSNEVPLLDQGASLSFVILPLPNGHLRFDLSVEAKERDVFFQIEHRRNDITPFLFALSTDDAPVGANDACRGIFGGVTSMQILAGKGKRKAFSFKVDPTSVLALIGDREFSELAVVAAFCERRQEDGCGETVIQGVGDVPVIDDRVRALFGDDGEEVPFDHRPILIRSRPVKLTFSEGKWSVKPTKVEEKSEQGGAGQPTTRSESGSEGGDKPQPESEGRSR